jgi:Protein of unknown function (DUF1706)
LKAPDLENEVDRSELLRRIEHSYKRFDERLSRAVLHDVEASGVCGVLSVKDLVAHLTAHEQRTLDELRAAREGHTLAIRHEEMDSFNDGAVYAYRAATFDTVRRQWRRSYASVVQAINALKDADFHPQSDFVRALDDTIDGAVANNTYAHYDAHREQIEAWLKLQEEAND